MRLSLKSKRKVQPPTGYEKVKYHFIQTVSTVMFLAVGAFILYSELRLLLSHLK